MVAWFKHVGDQLGHVWRRSLQLRVVVSTLTLSLIVITILGVVLTSQITDRLLDAKISAAVEEMSRARTIVESQLAGVHDTSTQLARLESARNALSNGSSGQSGGEAGSFNAALAMVGENTQELSEGPVQEVPNELRRFVQQGQVSYQFATVSDPDGYHGRVLIIGSPSVEVPTLEVYLIFPLTSEERSQSLMRGTMFIGGAVLLVLLGAIALLVTRQVVLPIRSAARIAGRFADGRLKERMLVRGEDDMAKLAMSFNAMADSVSTQITQLEEFGNLQKRFTSDVSHELRTPLTTVRMAADLIHGSSDELDSALARSAELLVTELDRFEGLLNDLLEISRHDAGVAELQVESLDVRMCARAAISTVRHLAKESGAEVVVDLPEEPLVAEVDPRRVERVLRNLLANAIDHSEGKPVLIRMRGDADANAVGIVVRDQGVGLRPGEEKLVFNRFWRSDPSRMRRSGGTGLGLSISVEDTNLHDGKLEAWGELGVGASFRLTLPMIRTRRMGNSPLPLEPPKRRTTQSELTAGPTTDSDPAPAEVAGPNETADGSPYAADIWDTAEPVPNDSDAAPGEGAGPDETVEESAHTGVLDVVVTEPSSGNDAPDLDDGGLYSAGTNGVSTTDEHVPDNTKPDSVSGEPGANHTGPGSTSASQGSGGAEPDSADTKRGSSSTGAGSAGAGPGSGEAGSDLAGAEPGSSSVGPGSSDAGPDLADAESGSGSAGAGSSEAGPGSAGAEADSNSAGADSDTKGDIAPDSASVQQSSARPANGAASSGNSENSVLAEPRDRKS
jgi:two-component system sensor histidine kinase MtrB